MAFLEGSGNVPPQAFQTFTDPQGNVVSAILRDGTFSGQGFRYPDGTVDVTAANNLLQVIATDGAITITEGTVLVTKPGSPAALTLALPIAGPQGVAGGNDGQLLRVISVNVQANSVTTPLHGINGNKNVATLVPPSSALLLAYGGIWYNVTNQGSTLSGS
jgi:hypothetical protein